MALNIKDPKRFGSRANWRRSTGESITVAARRALEERLVRVRARAARGPAEDLLRQLVRRGRDRSMHDNRTADEIVGYDEDGLPR